MPIWRLQVAWQLDTAFPRDQIVITPHFNDQGVGTDPDGLCEALDNALFPWFSSTGQVTVKAYDAQGTPPVIPQGSAIRNAGATMNTDTPRELACCLSFFSGSNVPRKRGRLYIPSVVLSGALQGEPSPLQQQKVAQLVPIFTNLGGSDVDWCIYSRVNDQAYPVSNWYVDNEWDVIRSRGLRPTSRLTGTASE